MSNCKIICETEADQLLLALKKSPSPTVLLGHLRFDESGDSVDLLESLVANERMPVALSRFDMNQMQIEPRLHKSCDNDLSETQLLDIMSKVKITHREAESLLVEKENQSLLV